MRDPSAAPGTYVPSGPSSASGRAMPSGRTPGEFLATWADTCSQIERSVTRDILRRRWRRAPDQSDGTLRNSTTGASDMGLLKASGAHSILADTLADTLADA